MTDGIYKIISQRSSDNSYINCTDFQFLNKKIIKTFNLIIWSEVEGKIIVDLDKQAIAISAHSGAFNSSLKVRLYRVKWFYYLIITTSEKAPFAVTWLLEPYLMIFVLDSR